jgi:Cu2+-exporting ATPase
VPSGAVLLGEHDLTLQASEAFPDSLVARLTREENRQSPAAAVQHILKYYLVIIILIGLATGIGGVISGLSPLVALQRMISIFIISCPCAIGVAIPLVDRRASSAMAKIGVFIQNPVLWTSLPRIKHLVFDKTGTLTLENPELIDPGQIAGLSSGARKALHQMTRQSFHPLARALREGVRPPTDDPVEVKHLPGLGSVSQIDGHRWTLGKPGWRGQDNFTALPTRVLSCELARDGEVVETFTFHETLRPRAREALSSLSRNHHLHIFSGDQPTRVDRLARALGIPSDQAHASLDPDEKAALLRQLQPSLYLGDGMNDTLAFAEATLSGTPVADRSLLDRRSDFLFTCPGLSFLPTLFGVARWRRQTVGLIFGFTVVYNVAAVASCVLGHMTPLAAAILMPLSSVASLLIPRRGLPAGHSEGKPAGQLRSHPEPEVLAREPA